jgi:transcriptional regulator with XRE-family HTH domain
MAQDEEDTQEVFKNRLRSARDRRGVSQTQLAEAANMPSSSISHFEAGKRKPSFDNLKRLATALDVTTDYLLGRVQEMHSVGAAEKIHRHLANMSSSDLNFADKMIELLAQKNSGRSP